MMGGLSKFINQKNSNTLWSHAGYLDNDYEPIFFPSEEYDNGQAPTIAFVDLNGNQLQNSQQCFHFLNWDWDITLNTTDGTLTWNGKLQTSDIKFDKSVSQAHNYSIEVLTGSDKNAPADTLLYSTDFIQREDSISTNHTCGTSKNDSSELEDDETVFSATGSGIFDHRSLEQSWVFESNVGV